MFRNTFTAIALLATTMISGPLNAAPTVPSDYIVVSTDKNGNPTGYVTWKEPSQDELKREFCIDGTDAALDYPYCFGEEDDGVQDSGPDSDDT